MSSPATTPRRLPAISRVGARQATRRGWAAAAVAAAAVVALPVAVIVGSALVPSAGVRRALAAIPLLRMVVSTAALLVAVAFGTLVLGAGLAWLTTAYRFPGSRGFAWLLVLPLAMPGYVLGFVFLALLGATGPVQGTAEALFGEGVWFPEVRSLWGAALVLSLSLYPYVYLLARSALLEQGTPTLEAAQVLGHGRLRAARRVVLPLARPSLAAGLSLVMLETLTDFATVKYFNVRTLSLGIFQVWNGMFNRPAAVRLAALVLVFALLVVAVERLLRGRARYHQQGGGQQSLVPQPLRGGRAAAATAACACVLGIAFVGPVARLVAWSGEETVRGVGGLVSLRFLSYLGNSAVLAGITAVGCVVLALLVTNAARLNPGRATRGAAQVTTVGYAVPGPVVAIGVLVIMAGVDRWLAALGLPGVARLLVTGSIAGLVYAELVRFTALSYHGVDASLQKVTPPMTASALTLGASPARVLRRVHLPLMRAGVGVALVLICVDVIKELPIVLLLRPFGFTTLSVWVWQLASGSRWAAAALPALTIVAVSAIPVAILFRPRGRRDGGSYAPAVPAARQASAAEVTR